MSTPVKSEGSVGPSEEGGERTIRGRGGFKSKERCTVPEGIVQTVAAPSPGEQVREVLANFVRISPFKDRVFQQYRVEFSPNIENPDVRKRLFAKATEPLFGELASYDNWSDARSSKKLPNETTTVSATNPDDSSIVYTITLKHVGVVVGGPELIRLYNMQMNKFLLALNFFRVSKSGAYVHHERNHDIIGKDKSIVCARGFRTAANVHKGEQIMMNFEPVHKLMQIQNVLQYMTGIRAQVGQQGDLQRTLEQRLVGKLVVPSYNRITYRIEGVDQNKSAKSTFFDRRNNRMISYMDYFKERYNVSIKVPGQPLLLVVNNNRRRAEQEETDKERNEIHMIPELCNIAGLTDSQRADFGLKNELIRSSQIAPQRRVEHLRAFLNDLHNNEYVKKHLNNWGYTYDKDLISIKARTLPTESIGLGEKASQPPSAWDKIDPISASFDRALISSKLAKAPEFNKLVYIISQPDFRNQDEILSKLRRGFENVGLKPLREEVVPLNDDRPNQFVNALRNGPRDASAFVVILNRQMKDRYDAIKKVATVDEGLITQVVTAKLMTDPRKAGGAAAKIGIQLAAKLGGEPWHINLPLPPCMICGYDTYHDTANRGRSFGAFVASMNSKFSRWFSKADSHDRLDELSSHMAQNMSEALVKFRQINNRVPERVFIYRDGVGDGQLDHVYDVELSQVRKAVHDFDQSIRLTFIVVNKRIGARFFMKTHSGFDNPTPGTVIDDQVTRQQRYDFYLVSQSTRNGTVTPTYYNVLEDKSTLPPGRLQMMSYKLCLNYYNWSGTVRVPSPCQYAHKLALLCGEHLHSVPNASLNDRLHFL